MMQVSNRLFKWNYFSSVGKIIIKNFIAPNADLLCAVGEYEERILINR